MDGKTMSIIKGKNILIIDDSKARLTKISSILTKWGMRCTGAASVEEALIVHINNKIDVSICKLDIPDMGANEFSQQIAERTDIDFPIIATIDKHSILPTTNLFSNTFTCAYYRTRFTYGGVLIFLERKNNTKIKLSWIYVS